MSFSESVELSLHPSAQTGRVFSEVVSELLEIYATKAKKTYEEFESITRLHLLPFFKDRPIKDVPLLWRQYVAHQKRLNPKRRLWHDRKVLRVILHFAKDQRILDFVPRMPLDLADKVKRVPVEISQTDFELALKHSTPLWRDMLIVLRESGMRFSECRQMRREYVDFDAGLIRLPGEIVKTRQGRTYRMSQTLREVLARRAKTASGSFLFSKRGSGGREPISESHRSFDRMRKETGIRFTLHDLRRGFITSCVERGMPLELACKLTGTSPQVARDCYLLVSERDWFRFDAPPHQSKPCLGQPNPAKPCLTRPRHTLA